MPLTGRFAPSPTGPLHLGSLRTALAAWLFARTAGGRFLIRVEDIDPVRSRPEFESLQLSQLAELGIDWDGDVVRQSERHALYAAALERLPTYRCYCTRAELAERPCPCREAPTERARSSQRVDARGEVDDFVVRRADGAYAYQLAVVVDDFDQGVTQVVRGADLLDSTPRQNWLQRELGYRSPSYVHVPLVMGPDGRRLAKRYGSDTRAEPFAWLAASLGMPGARDTAELLERFSPDLIPREPVTSPPPD